MTVGTARTGNATTFAYGVTISSVVSYTTINLLESVDGPNATLSVVEIVPLGSTYKGKLPSLSDGGEISFTGYFDATDSTHLFLLSLLGTRTLLSWRITYPDASTVTLSGFLSGFHTTGMSAEEAVKFEGTVMVNGALTFA